MLRQTLHLGDDLIERDEVGSIQSSQNHALVASQALILAIKNIDPPRVVS